MKDYQPSEIRNIAIAGHGGTGKTSLTEAMLFVAGVINRLGHVEEGSTSSDFDPDETKRRISVNASVLPLDWEGTKVNILDTPGYADFVGEEKSGLRAADAAILVIDAAAGVQVGTEYAWQFMDERKLSRAIFINRFDRENAEFERVLDDISGAFGKRCVPVEVPIGAQDQFKGVVDLIALTAYLGDKAGEQPVPADLSETVQSYRERLIEAIAESDDELLNKFLEGEELTPDELHRGLRGAVLSGSVVPVLIGSATRVLGVHNLLNAALHHLPSPADIGGVTATEPGTGKEQMLQPNPTGPLAALVFKTTADPYVGRLSFVRVYSGTLKADSQVWNANKGHAERIGPVYVQRGKNQEQAGHILAGDIGVIPKMNETTTSDTLCSHEHPVILPPVHMPAPAYSASVSPKTKADADKVGSALHRITEEDPTLNVGRDPDTGELILSGLGESHVEVAVEKMQRKFGVALELKTPKVPYKETITAATNSEYRHKKQTGGAGQFGQVTLTLEPQPRGGGVEFAEHVVGGVVPREYFPAVEKGVREAAQEGVLAHYPLVDVKVTLVDGKYHPVDSKAIAFEIAGMQALKQGVQQAKPVLLEPIMHLLVRVPESYTGDVISDLNSKRAKVHGMSPEDGATVIDAEAPLAEIQHYATDLRSLTQGRGSFTSGFDRYEEVPAHIAQRVIDGAKREAEARS